ncbi:hypothetical protein KCP76_03530 [Salmonella enterica subsp. enterica serovar Weltevreden]|nr:hypothetical protein KCP76_03530 [Salmonella enterica subsp. enterica serovar Weltevreden]
MFVIAALLIALDDSAAGIGALRRGIATRAFAAGDMSTIGICALLALCLVAIGWCCYALQTIFAARAAESVQHTVRLRSFSHLLRLVFPAREAHRLASFRMTVDVDSLSPISAKRSCQRGHQHLTMVAIAPRQCSGLTPFILALTALSAVPVVILATWILPPFELILPTPGTAGNW